MIDRAPNGAILDIGPAIERRRFYELNQKLVRDAINRERRRLRWRRRARRAAIAVAVIAIAAAVAWVLL